MVTSGRLLLQQMSSSHCSDFGHAFICFGKLIYRLPPSREQKILYDFDILGRESIAGFGMISDGDYHFFLEYLSLL